MKILFYDAKNYDIDSFNRENEDYGYKLKFVEFKLNEDTAHLSKGYDVVCVFVNDVVNKEVIDTLCENGVKMIALRCAGYNNVDFHAAHERIHVVRVPAYSPYAVAEHTAALLLTLNRKIHKAYNRVRENNFSIGGLVGFDLYGKKIGVIGTGKIGQIFINIAKGFGMEVLAYDKYPNSNLDVTYVDLKTLYREADIISLHCPLLKDTEHIINEESIALMKDGVVIINTSRGGLIHADALVQGLKNRKIGGAALDVYEEESDYFFEDLSEDIIDDDTLSRLISFPNVIVTSHQAFLTREALGNISHTTMENIRSLKEEGIFENEICYNCRTKPD